MFGFFKSESAKLRDTAKNWLYLAGKVYHFRKDKLSESDTQKLVQLSEEVKAGMKSKASEGRLKSSIEGLKEHLEHVGGNYYPRGSLAENVEFFFVAIIIYLGFTTFFIKPFKIPTNSMWPTYHGMTAEVYTEEEETPSALEKAFRFIAIGAKNYEIEAPASGEVLVPMVATGEGYYVPWRQSATVRRYFVIPSPGVKYTLFVGEQPVSFTVPADFDFDKQVQVPLARAGERTPFDMVPRRLTPDRIAGRIHPQVVLARTGLTVEEGETLLEFDLLTGDQLFVDRMAYHFVRPEVGDGFVFKTGQIPELGEDKFYIKRLVGTPGDTVQIKDGDLYVNGEPAQGSVAFELNAKEVDDYQGYTAGLNQPMELDLSQPVTVPEDSYLALGDNSYNSLDGRSWGFVPEDSVVGRPIVIYYPFTWRFGPVD